MNNKILIAAIAFASALASGAQTTYFRDSSGRIQGTSTTDRNGKTTYRDGSGRLIGTRTVR